MKLIIIIATFIRDKLEIYGATNLKKTSNNTDGSVEENKAFTIGSDVNLAKLIIKFKFDAKLGVPKYRLRMRQKKARITIKRCIFYFEFAVHTKEKFVKLNNVRLISYDRIFCKTGGFIWPFNRTVETLIKKHIEKYIRDNQAKLEDNARKGFVALYDPYTVYHELKQQKEFIKIIEEIKFD